MCNCIKNANKTLAARNTAIDTVMALTPAGKCVQKLCIPTRSTDTGKRKKPALKVFVSFCPLCGEKVNNDE